MLIAFEQQCLMRSFLNPTAVVLPTCNGVGGCLWPISSSAILMGIASHVARNAAATSDSMAELMTGLIIFANA